MEMLADVARDLRLAMSAQARARGSRKNVLFWTGPQKALIMWSWGAPEEARRSYVLELMIHASWENVDGCYISVPVRMYL